MPVSVLGRAKRRGAGGAAQWVSGSSGCGSARRRLDQLERAVQAALVVAGVVRPAERGPVRELADEVAAAQLDGIEVQLAGGVVERGLDQVARLGAAGAAVGRGRDLVGAGAGDEHLDGLDVVTAGQQHRGRVRRDRRARQQVGAEVGEQAAAEGEDAAGRRRSASSSAPRSPRPCGADEEVLAAVLGPFDGRLSCCAASATSGVSTGSVPLEPKPPPTSGTITRSALLGAAEAERELLARAVRALAATCRPSAGRPRARRARRAAPSGRAARRGITVLLADDVGGAGERAGDVARALLPAHQRLARARVDRSASSGS